MDPQDPLLLVTSREEIKELFFEVFEDRICPEFESTSASSETQEREWLSNREAMDYLSLSKSTLERYRRQGVLDYYKIEGNFIRYRRADLDAWIEEHRVSKSSGSNGAP